MKQKPFSFGLAVAMFVVALVAVRYQSGYTLPMSTAVSVSSVQTKASQAAITPTLTLAKLKAGNARFVADKPLQRNLPAKVAVITSMYI